MIKLEFSVSHILTILGFEKLLLLKKTSDDLSSRRLSFPRGDDLSSIFVDLLERKKWNDFLRDEVTVNVAGQANPYIFAHFFLRKSLVFFNIVDDDDVMLKNLKLFWLTTVSHKSEETLKSFFVCSAFGIQFILGFLEFINNFYRARNNAD